MPILEIDEKDKIYKTVQERKENKPFRTQEEMKTSVLFNKEAPLETIIRYPRGMNWEIDYFLQIRDLNDELIALDINLTPSVQKYNRINKLNLKLQTAISQDQIDSVSGEAIINAGFLPNMFDMFLATLMGGRQALFMVTDVQTRTYNIHKAYYVSFKIFSFVDDKPEIYNDLINKVMKEYVYDKDHLLDYSAPVILAQDYKTKLSLKDTLPEITDYYMEKFVNHDKRVIALPTNTSIYVDPYLNSFLFKIINHTDQEVFDKLQNIELSVTNNTPYTIWDLIIDRNTKMLKRCNRNIGFKYHAYGLTQVMTKTMNYLGINFIATPLQDGESSSISNTNIQGSHGNGHNYDTKYWGHYHPSTPDNRFDKTEPPPYDHNKVCPDNCDSYHNTSTDVNSATVSNIIDISLNPKPEGFISPLGEGERLYVLSSNFYNQVEGSYSLIEKLLMLYLSGHMIPADELQTLIDQYMYWDTIDQYYLLPILLVLVKEAVANTFKSL